jgi:hypothetical protein|nr:MAG TPA: DNA-directed RNA polymerase [Caudoviricetes sp.]
MAEYVERTAVFEQFDNADADVCETDDFGGVDYGFGMKNIKELINAIPAADVAQVVHGRWEYTPQTFNTLGQIRCPFCAWWSLDQSIDGIYKYCPNCGAKMDGGDNDATD